MSQGAPAISRALLKSIFTGQPIQDPKGRAMQKVPREMPRVAEPEDEVIPSYSNVGETSDRVVNDDEVARVTGVRYAGGCESVFLLVLV